MSFTDDDREKIRRFLGYPPTTAYLAQINLRCAELEAASPATVGTCQALIRQVVKLENQISEAVPFDSTTFQSNASGTRQGVPGQRTAMLKQEAIRQRNQLASTLQLMVINCPFQDGGAWNTSPIYRA